MHKIPDVLGYPLKGGLSLLEEAGLSVIMVETSPQGRRIHGEERIARLVEGKDNTVFVVVVKVPIPPILNEESH